MLAAIELLFLRPLRVNHLIAQHRYCRHSHGAYRQQSQTVALYDVRTGTSFAGFPYPTTQGFAVIVNDETYRRRDGYRRSRWQL